MPRILVEYRLTGVGWSETVVQIGAQSTVVTASYLSDALGDLLTATIAVLSGSPEATATFAEEPGEYRWRFCRVEPDQISVRILSFDRLWGNEPDEKGQELLNAECRLRTFAGTVLSATQRLLEEHGLDGYHELWGNFEFPLHLHHELQERLAKGPDLQSPDA